MNESSDINFPLWLNKSLVDIVNTESSYVGKLNQMVGQVMHKGHVNSMEALKPQALEKILFTESRKLCASKDNTVLSQKLCQLLTKNIRREVEERLAHHRSAVFAQDTVKPDVIAAWTKRLANEGHSAIATTSGICSSTLPSRADLIAAEAREATVALLRKHPKLCQMLAVRLCNHPLQGLHFRRQVWSIILANKRVRNLYIELLRNDVKKTQSIREQAILRQCQEYLEHEVTMTSMRGSVGCLHAMGTVLSFFHLVLNSTDNVNDAHVRIAGTLVLSVSDHLSKIRPPHLDQVVSLIEQFFTLMSQLPAYVTKQPPLWFRRYHPSANYGMNESQTSQTESEMRLKFGTHVLQQLRFINADVANEILNELSTNQINYVPFDVSQQEENCSIVMYEAVYPIIETLFTGFLKPDTLLFIWDQILFCLSGAAPVEHSLEYLLSAVSAILLHLTWLHHSSSSAKIEPDGKFRTVSTNTEFESIEEVKDSTEIQDCIKQNPTFALTEETTSSSWSWIERVRKIALQLNMEDLRFLIKKHFFTGFYHLLSETDQFGGGKDRLSILQAQNNWSGWFSLFDEPHENLLLKRENQRVLRLSELDKLQKLEMALKENQRISDDLRIHLNYVQEDFVSTREQLKQAKLKEQQLEAENKSWELIVRNLEQKLSHVKDELETYVQGNRKLKISQYNLSSEQITSNKESTFSEETHKPNISNSKESDSMEKP